MGIFVEWLNKSVKMPQMIHTVALLIILHIFTARKRSLGQGNVFVTLSDTLPPRQTPLGQMPLGRHPLG